MEFCLTKWRTRLAAALLCIFVTLSLQAHIQPAPKVQQPNQEKPQSGMSGHSPAAAPVESHPRVMDGSRQTADGTKTRNAPFASFLTVAALKIQLGSNSDVLTDSPGCRGPQSYGFLVPPDRAPPAHRA